MLLKLSWERVSEWRRLVLRFFPFLVILQIVAKFFASWCGPCQKMAPVFVDFSKRFGDRLVFLKIDIEEVSVSTPHPLHAWIGIQVFGAFWLFVFICNASFHLKLAHYQVHRDGS